MTKEKRILYEAEYMIYNHATVRQTAKAFGISKSTVYKEMSIELKDINAMYYYLVKQVLAENKKERAIRGGNATKEKYSKMKAK